MGQTNSHPTPLSLFLNNLKDFRDHGHSIGLEDLKPVNLGNLCEQKWHAIYTTWPQEGTFHLSIIGKTKDVIQKEHHDQLPYISIWEDVVYYLHPGLGPWFQLSHQ